MTNPAALVKAWFFGDNLKLTLINLLFGVAIGPAALLISDNWRRLRLGIVVCLAIAYGSAMYREGVASVFRILRPK